VIQRTDPAHSPHWPHHSRRLCANNQEPITAAQPPLISDTRRVFLSCNLSYTRLFWSGGNDSYHPPSQSAARSAAAARYCRETVRVRLGPRNDPAAPDARFRLRAGTPFGWARRQRTETLGQRSLAKTYPRTQLAFMTVNVAWTCSPAYLGFAAGCFCL